jgi:hypothetical protein
MSGRSTADRLWPLAQPSGSAAGGHKRVSGLKSGFAFTTPLRTSGITATHSIASTVLVSIDISKHRHEGLIEVPGKKRRRSITIIDT